MKVRRRWQLIGMLHWDRQEAEHGVVVGWTEGGQRRRLNNARHVRSSFGIGILVDLVT